MEILTKEEIKNYPNGTIFCTYTPNIFTSNYHIITESSKDGWNSELSLEPSIKDGCTQWCTDDTCWWEYDDNQLFVVFDTQEVQQIVNCFIWALTGCKGYFNEDVWQCGNGIVLKDEVFYDKQ